MKRVKSVKQVAVRQSTLLAGLVLASFSAHASVEFTTYESVFTNVYAPVYGGEFIIHNDVYQFIPTPFVYQNAASASSSVSGAMTYQVGSNAGNFSESDSSNVGSPVEVSLERKGHAYQAASSADVGQLQARAETKWNSSNGNGYNYGSNFGSSSANGSSTWSDWFVISGGTGEATASFVSLLDGMMSSSKNGSASYGLTISYSTGAYCYASCGESDQNQTVFSQTSSLSGRGKTALSQQIEGEFTFAYDTPFQLTATLTVGASSGGVADFSFGSLSSSLVLPTGVQLASASGFFAQPVPEPETYAMMLAGLGLVGFAAARRRAAAKAR